jgi:hypothetical protein
LGIVSLPLPISTASNRLTLNGLDRARQAPEPVFSVAEELAFQSFQSVFRTGLVDPALMNAVMLSLALAVTGGSIDRECLGYQGRAISCIRAKMSSLAEATSESTIGAILLLAGVEVCIPYTLNSEQGPDHVKLTLMGPGSRWHDVPGPTPHEGGAPVAQDLPSGGHLSLRRNQAGHILVCKDAISFQYNLTTADRQDLNSSILAGSSRVVDHTTFAELHWRRDPFSPSFSQLPPGFQKRSHLLTREFVEVLEDINALQCIRDLSRFTKGDVMQMAHINNHIASIQSRLVGLPKLSLVLECSRLAAYLCSAMLCCTVWCALVIPVGKPHALRITFIWLSFLLPLSVAFEVS